MIVFWVILMMLGLALIVGTYLDNDSEDPELTAVVFVVGLCSLAFGIFQFLGSVM